MMTLWSWISSLQSCEKIPSLVGLAAQSVVLHFGSPNKHIYLWYLWSRHQRKLNLDSKHRCFESKFQITSSLPPTMHTYTHSHTHTHGDMHYSWTHMHLASLKGRMYLIAHKLTLPSPPSAFISILLFVFSLSLITCTFHSTSSLLLLFPWKCMGCFSHHKHLFWNSHRSIFYILTFRSVIILHSVSLNFSSRHIWLRTWCHQRLLGVDWDWQRSKLHGMM